MAEEKTIKQRVDTLTRYFFGGFGNRLAVLSMSFYYLKEPLFAEEKKEEAKEYIRKSFAWIKRKYEQIPFSELSETPHYSDFKPLFKINKLLPDLGENIEIALNEDEKTAAIENIGKILHKITQLGADYAETVNRYYKELTGKNLGSESVETRALLEYRSKEQIGEHVRWLKENNIKPNSFERAAMDYYGVPWEPKERLLKESTENGWLFKKVIDEEYAGSLEIWVMGKGEYKIENIHVEPKFRRRGVASELIEEVIKEFVPYNELKWGMQTEEGAKLKVALDKKYKIIKEPRISKYSWLKDKYH